MNDYTSTMNISIGYHINIYIIHSLLSKFDLSLLEIQDSRPTTNLSSPPSPKKKTTVNEKLIYSSKN